MDARSRACAAMVAVLAACSERPPSVPLRDAGSSMVDDDGGGGPGQTDSGYRRPDGGPLLPPADLEVTLPYLGPEVRVPLQVAADLGTLDVFLSIDTTGSFGGEIDALQRDLIGEVVPALVARVPDVAVGVGRFEDFPTPPFGSEDDRPFRLVAPITTDRTRVSSALASLDDPLGLGGDVPESGAEALWQIATGAGYAIEGRTLVAAFRDHGAPGGGDVGGAGFRDGALRVVVHVTDAPSHSPSDYLPSFPGTHSMAAAAEALESIDVRAIGIASGPAPRSELEQLAIRTGAVMPPSAGQCLTGIDGAARAPVSGVCPLVFDVAENGSGLSSALVDAMHGLLDTVQWDEVWGEADDQGVGLVQAVAAIDAEVAPGTTPPERADRRPAGDGVADTFVSVRPGTTVRFELVLRNETVRPADYDQVFRVSVQVVGDGLDLVERTVRVLVPRGRLDAGVGIDAGAGDDAGNELDAGDELDGG